MGKVSVFSSNLEPLDAEKIDEALGQWQDEDDGTDDYPSFGEVVSVRFGIPKRLSGFSDKQLLDEVKKRQLIHIKIGSR